MTRRLTILTVALTATVAFFVGLVVAGTLVPAPAHSGPVRPERPAATTASAAAVERPGTVVDFAEIAARINPAVVNIAATVRRPSRTAGRHPLDGPQGPDRGFGISPDQSRTPPRQGSGSGVIIEADGHILTNHHVVRDADRIVVKLSDGRTWRAALVGADPATDLALLKVDASSPLPVAPLGDSDRVRVGEWVCAIGNPLAYEHTVTVGVVSYKGRKLFDASLDRYIQTDAAITFGNSGGPLLNARGDVIGITSAISSQASGIGFAVPINQARAILPQLERDGHVTRGYVGVTLRDLDPDVRVALHLDAVTGALVQEVIPDSPGDHAGLRPYDLIRAVDGREVESNDGLIGEIARRTPGDTVRLRIRRDGGERTLRATLTARPSSAHAESPEHGFADAHPERLGDAMGLLVRDLDADLVEHFALPAGMTGVVVVEVEPLSPAGDAGVRRGSVILEVNRTRVEAERTYHDLVDAASPGDVLSLYVYDPARRGRVIYAVRLERAGPRGR